MIDYKNLKHHALSEKIVDALSTKVGSDQKEFFRIHTSYYLSLMAAMMRTNVKLPGNHPQPVSLYALNLAPSGWGKGHSTSILEKDVINKFRSTFVDKTFPQMALENIPKLSHSRSVRNGSDPDDELIKTEKEFERSGSLPFFFDDLTVPAIKQLRNTLLMANGGSLNLQIDEIGSHLAASREGLIAYLELFDGSIKQKLVKNTNESIRSEDIIGITPANMMLFGVSSALLDGGKTEEELISLFSTGYARRCFFGFIQEETTAEIKLISPADKLASSKLGTTDAVLATISSHFGLLANMTNAHKNLIVPDDTALLFYEYENDCKVRAHELKEHDSLRKTELRQRAFKTIRLAGAYAFADQTAEVTVEQLEAAMAIAEESGESFKKILNRDRSYVKLAKYMATSADDVTQTDLLEDLPFYKGTQSVRSEMMVQATAWGYKNSILIKKTFVDGIEFFRGETLKPTNLDEMILSTSFDITDNYENRLLPFSSMYELATVDNVHWVNHHTTNGHRSDEYCQAGFNMVVIDVDDGVTLEMARSLLDGYKALFYTTKRHTPEKHRFRIVMPTNYHLKLDGKDFKEFMSNLFEWLPFDSDKATGQRSRKWLSAKGSHAYTEGKLLDVLPFIPKTSKNEERKAKFTSLQSLDNLERWVVQNTGDGNRNNQLLKFAFILLDGGYDGLEIQTRVLAMNAKLSDSLDESEIIATVMNTITKKLNDKKVA